MHEKSHELLRQAGAFLVEDRLYFAKGDRFNVFSILQVDNLETYHSRFLAELLDPRGSHGMGDRFLRAFTKHFEIPGLNPATSSVALEYHLGEKTSEEGGRIDVLVRDWDGNVVGIENKIHAQDQHNQISSYQKSLPEITIVYLTLDRHEPADIEICDRKRLLCRSYKEHAVGWLEACRREATDAPLVRETINQYLNLLRILTHWSTLMNDEIANAVLKSNDGTLAAYLELVRAKDAVNRAISDRLKSQCGNIGKALKLYPYLFAPDLSVQWSCFGFADQGMERDNIWIKFQFTGAEYHGLNCGISYIDKEKNAGASLSTRELWTRITQKYRSSAISLGFGEVKKEAEVWWPGVSEWNERLNWDEPIAGDDSTLVEVAFHTGTFEADLDAKVKALLEVVWSARGPS